MPADPLVPVTLVTGPEELLADRHVRAAIEAARAADPQVEVLDVTPDRLPPGELTALTSPSMFGERKVVVIREAHDLGEEVRDEVLAYAARPSDDVVLVVVHPGGVKGKKLITGLTELGVPVRTVAAVSRPSERVDFVVAEARRFERSLRPGAAQILVDAVGSDLRELAAAVEQLCHDAPPGDQIDERIVSRSHKGRAETTGFQIADAVLEGQGERALALLRQAREGGVADVLLVSALASGLRDVTAVRGAEGSQGSVAKQLGMPPWKVQNAQRRARTWSDKGLADALCAVAAADEGVKGGAADPGWALERAVLAILGCRGSKGAA